MSRTLQIIAAAVLVLAGVELFMLHWLRPLENRLLDSFVRSQAARLAPDPDIVMIDIDEKSLAEMEKQEIGVGRWPWPRVIHASLVEGLSAQKPRAIVFDISFTEADTFRPRDDAAFAETIARHKNT
jgi:adenylate cyclase